MRRDDTLTETEITLLHELARRTKGGEALELDGAGQLAHWTRMDEMGFARISDSAVVGFEKVRGTFVTISAAGKAYLALND